MNAITIRNLSEEESRKLEELAAENGTSVELEAQRILREGLLLSSPTGNETSENGESQLGLGTALRQLAEQYPELEDLEFPRDQTPARAAVFE